MTWDHAGDRQFAFSLSNDIPVLTLYRDDALYHSMLHVYAANPDLNYMKSNNKFLFKYYIKGSSGLKNFDQHPIILNDYDGVYSASLYPNSNFYFDPISLNFNPLTNDLDEFISLSDANSYITDNAFLMVMANCGKCNHAKNGPRYYYIAKQNSGYAVRSN